MPNYFCVLLTIYNLGFLSFQNPKTENNPYLGFIFTSFQERATFISHGNTARHAKEHGNLKLAQLCGIIASDEKRHETAYTKIVEKLFEVDPDGRNHSGFSRHDAEKNQHASPFNV